MQLYAIKTGVDGMAGSLAEFCNHCVNILLAHSPRRRDLDKAGRFAAVINKYPYAFGLDGGCRDGLGAADIIAVGDPAHMPELGKDEPTLGMNGLCDQTPACHLLGTVDARCPGVALAQGGDLRPLTDDETSTGPLGIVFGHQCIGHIAGLAGAGAGHGWHDDAIGELEMAQTQRVEQWILRHGGVPRWLTRQHQWITDALTLARRGAGKNRDCRKRVLSGVQQSPMVFAA